VALGEEDHFAHVGFRESVRELVRLRWFSYRLISRRVKIKVPAKPRLNFFVMSFSVFAAEVSTLL
jgi:hypothetical protein